MILFINIYYSQEETSVNVDLLKAPSSPASNLLGIANSDINKPTDIANLMLNLQDVTSMFKNQAGYALDFSPYWLFGKSTKSLDNIINDNNTSDILKQTLVFSVAIKNTDSTSTNLPTNSVFTSLGFKFSLFRGEINETVRKKYDSVKKLHKKIIDDLVIKNKNISNDPQVLSIEKDLAIMFKAGKKETTQYQQLKTRLDSIKNEKLIANNTVFNSSQEKIKLLLKDFNISRKGFLWDFAGGTSLQFKEKRFNNSRIYNAGLWTVFGYAFENSGIPLLLVRYMYNPKSDWMTTEDFKPDGNFSTFDAGIKYEYSPKDSKFTGSFEGLYRSFISGSDLKPTWKCVLNLDYAIFPNQHLTLSLGKDFDNNIIKSGNVIAGLSFLSGIGTKRKIQ
ncbi:hypothetical protein NZ698_12085 [Chryseobacterium sp. PBS4-4]|uniref:DUF3078 domain-containing protein n=2 Tax=Chryseobacterium edaphi TaxID=2976532 RepID=A0ABT2W7J1_9FLAO|nr:hypothetical protein [Chryseobacterium edaphi]